MCRACAQVEDPQLKAVVHSVNENNIQLQAISEKIDQVLEIENSKINKRVTVHNGRNKI